MRGRFAAQIGEDGLGDVTGQIGGIHLAQRGGIDEVRVAADKLGEGGFGAFGGVGAQELDVGRGLHSPVKPPPTRESDRKFSDGQAGRMRYGLRDAGVTADGTSALRARRRRVAHASGLPYRNPSRLPRRRDSRHGSPVFGR